MKKYLFSTIGIFCMLFGSLFYALPAGAKVEWEMLKDISLDDAPKDIIITRDGTTAYILGEQSIILFSLQENRVIETIPLKAAFSNIALAPDETTLFLTSPQSKQISLMQIAQVYEIEAGKSPVIGKAKAPVSIVAFLDYQCPYCARVYPTLKQLLEKYPKDVGLIIKHYPLPMHRFAEKAAQAALAAEKQNKYDKLTEVLFANFSKLNDQTIQQYAQEAGLDVKKFEKDMTDSSVNEIISADKQLAQKLKVRAVPTIFINGAAAKGRTVEAFSQMVEQELKKKK
jgi:protein-disulfide isomerase